MKKLSEILHLFTGVNPETLNKIIASLLIIFVLWIFRLIILKIIRRKTEDVKILYNWRKATAYISVAIGFLFVGRIWFEGIGSLTTFLGLLSAGLAIALKDLIADLAAWIFIMWRRPFTVGDRIQIREHAGDVIDIRPFQFTIMEIGKWVDADQSTGRVIHISNGLVINSSLINYSKGFQYIWDEIPVLITFESNWKNAKEIIQKIANKHAETLSGEAQKKVKEASKKFMIFYSVLTPTVYTSVKDSGVLLTARYLTQPRNRRSSQQAIWEDILEEFGKSNEIDFAYPTQRFYNNLNEGKESTKPSQDE